MSSHTGSPCHSQCGDGLTCFQRTGTQSVPGCRGNGDFSVDYCIIALPIESPAPSTKAPSVAPVLPLATDDTAPPTITATNANTLEPTLLVSTATTTTSPTSAATSSLMPTGAESFLSTSTDTSLPPTLRAEEKVTMSPTEGSTRTVEETMLPTALSSNTFVPSLVVSWEASTTEEPTVGKKPIDIPTAEVPTQKFPGLSPRIPTHSMIPATSDPTVFSADTEQPSLESSNSASGTGQPTMDGTTISATLSPTETTEDEIVFNGEREVLQETQSRQTPPFVQAFEREVETPSRLPYLELLGADGVFESFPLGPCQGSCFDDRDCLDGLICFQRQGDEAVPGCRGKGHSSANYCVFSVMSAMETGPDDQERESPTMDVLPHLQLLGEDEIFDVYPLSICQGSCFDDYDCTDGLICLHRDGDEPVPGCTGSPHHGENYCVNGFEEEAPTTVPDMTQTFWSESMGASSVAPSLTDPESVSLAPSATVSTSTTMSFTSTDTEHSTEEETAPSPLQEEVLLSAFATATYAPSDHETDLPRLQIVGNDGIFDFYPITACLGDCDFDADVSS